VLFRSRMDTLSVFRHHLHLW